MIFKTDTGTLDPMRNSWEKISRVYLRDLAARCPTQNSLRAQLLEATVFPGDALDNSVHELGADVSCCRTITTPKRGS